MDQRREEKLFSDGHGDLLSGVHGVKTYMYAANFILEHIAEHAVIEGIVHLLHQVTDAGSKSIIYGDQAAAHTMHFLHMFLHYVMMSEFVKAWNGNATMYRIPNDFARQETEHNSTKNRSSMFGSAT